MGAGERQIMGAAATAAAYRRCTSSLHLAASAAAASAAAARLPTAAHPALAAAQAIRDHSKILMGKNTMMRRCIRLYAERTGNDQWLQLLDHMVRRGGGERGTGCPTAAAASHSATAAAAATLAAAVAACGLARPPCGGAVPPLWHRSTAPPALPGAAAACRSQAGAAARARQRR